MSYLKKIDQIIEDTERKLALLHFVKQNVPDVKVHNGKYCRFTAKSVNSTYNNFDFITTHNGLYVTPYIQLNFEYDGKVEKIKISSSPRTNRLAYHQYNYRTKTRTIKFSRLLFNLKNNNFKEDMLNACQIKILDFIKQRPDSKLDQKHLSPRLKKLLLFT